jgi:hypothetical protein
MILRGGLPKELFESRCFYASFQMIQQLFPSPEEENVEESLVKDRILVSDMYNSPFYSLTRAGVLVSCILVSYSHIFSNTRTQT